MIFNPLLTLLGISTGYPVGSLMITMDTAMFASTQYHEIFGAIILIVMVYMMHMFFSQKESANLFLHNKTVFRDIVPNSVRVRWAINQNVPSFINNLTTFPINRFFTRTLGVILLGKTHFFFRCLAHMATQLTS